MWTPLTLWQTSFLKFHSLHGQIIYFRIVYGDYSHLWPLMGTVTIVTCGLKRVKRLEIEPTQSTCTV